MLHFPWMLDIRNYFQFLLSITAVNLTSKYNNNTSITISSSSQKLSSVNFCDYNAFHYLIYDCREFGQRNIFLYLFFICELVFRIFTVIAVYARR